MDLGRFSWRCGVLLISSISISGLSGCSTTNDATELAKVQSAATAYKALVTNLTSPADTAHDVEHVHIARELLTANSAVKIDDQCYKAFSAAFATYLDELSKSQDEQDQAYRAMIKAAQPCSKFVKPLAVGAPAAEAGAVAAQIEKAIAAAKSKGIDQKTSRNDVTDALEKYFDNIQAIVSATSISDITTATASLETDAKALATAVKAPAEVGPILDLANKLAGAALEEMRYDALRKYVLAMDPLLQKAAPVLGAGLRMRQGLDIHLAAVNAARTAGFINGIINSPDLLNQPIQRYALYNSAEPSLDDANATLQSLAKDDPAIVVTNLVQAHHDLEEVLKSNKHQTKGALSTASAIAEGGVAIVNASK